MIQMRATIYSKDGCSRCDDAVKMCVDNGLQYNKINMEREQLEKLCGDRIYGYPQIFIGNKHIGDILNFKDYIDEFEPMLVENPNRFTIFPIKHTNLWDLYKKAQMSNWTAEEIDLSSDMTDWEAMSDNERHFIKHILAFFAASDGIVFENISVNFAREVQYPEARSFYAYQEHNEMVHGETYSKLIDRYVLDINEKDRLFRAIETIPCVKAKADWALKWFDSSQPFSN